jgi:quercetin dioxygenase-like cupin family protein
MPAQVSIDDLPGGDNATLFEGQDHGSTVSGFLVHASPGGGPGLHHHPYEETFIVQEGHVTFTADGETIEAGAGQIVVVPAGAAHSFVNSGDDVLRMVTIHPSDHVIQEWLEEG